MAPPAPVRAQAGVSVDMAVAVASEAVREAFGGDAEVRLDGPVLTMVRNATLVSKAVPEPSSRTGGPVRFVLYADPDATTRVGRLTARVTVRAPHVRAAQRVAARATIGDADLETHRDDIGRQRLAPLPTLGAVRGATTRKALLPGEIVTDVVLVPRSVVTSGEEVVTVARVGALEVRGRAIAAQSGGVGETVIVVNPDSRKRLRARVVAGALVEVLHGS